MPAASATSTAGSTAIAISSVAIATTGSGDFADFSVLNLCPTSLAAGKSCALVVSFIPLHDNPSGVISSGSVLITDNAAGSPQSIPLTAKTINPHLTLSSTGLGFAPQPVGTTSPSKTVTLTNTGSSPLVLNSVVANGGDFLLASGTTCKAGTTLAPTQQCTIAIAFAPKTAGMRLGAIEITDNALFGTSFIRLVGTGE